MAKNSPPKDNLPATITAFGRAAEKLADTVRHVVDLTAGPDRLRAKAQAEAESALILTRGRLQVEELEVQALEARAVDRLRRKETRRQQNVESITIEAAKALPPPEQVSNKPVDADWTTRFFEECQDIGDKEMQALWGRILAGEVTRPGSFAPKTLSTVRDLRKEDAQLFAALGPFVWLVHGAGFVPIIRDVESTLVKKAGLNFMYFTHLSSIGLIEFGNLTGFGLRKQTEVYPLYYGHAYPLHSEAERTFSIGKVIFTAVGSELLRVASRLGDEEIRISAIEAWRKDGWLESNSELQRKAANE